MLGKLVTPPPMVQWPSDPNEGVLIFHPGYQCFFGGFFEDNPEECVMWVDGFQNAALAFSPESACSHIQALVARGHFCVAVRRFGSVDDHGQIRFPVCYVGGAQ